MSGFARGWRSPVQRRHEHFDTRPRFPYAPVVPVDFRPREVAGDHNPDRRDRADRAGPRRGVDVSLDRDRRRLVDRLRELDADLGHHRPRLSESTRGRRGVRAVRREPDHHDQSEHLDRRSSGSPTTSMSSSTATATASWYSTRHRSGDSRGERHGPARIGVPIVLADPLEVDIVSGAGRVDLYGRYF